jgi:mitochondrial fission process protein 1
MIWGSRRSDDDDGVEHTRNDARPDFSKQPIARENLPQQLQWLVDHEDDYFDELYSP